MTENALAGKPRFMVTRLNGQGIRLIEIPATRPDQVTHMLRYVDMASVEGAARLIRDFNGTPFLGGNVFDFYLRGFRNEYRGNIDVYGVMENGDRERLSNDLVRASGVPAWQRFRVANPHYRRPIELFGTERFVLKPLLGRRLLGGSAIKLHLLSVEAYRSRITPPEQL